MAADSKKPDLSSTASKTADPKAGNPKPATDTKAAAATGAGRKPVTIDLQAKEVGAAKAGSTSSASSASSSASSAAAAPSASSAGASSSAKPASGATSSPSAGSAKPSSAPPSPATASTASGSGSTPPGSSQVPSGSSGPSSVSSSTTGAKPASAATTSGSSQSAAATSSASSPTASSASAGGSGPAASAGTATTETAKPTSSATPSAASAASKLPRDKPAAAGDAKSSTGFGGLLAASLIGGAVALGGVWGANQAGLLSSGAISTEFQSALTAAQSRISGLETQLAGLAERETPSAAVEAGLKAAESRISDLEAALRDTGAAPDAATSALPEEATARIAEIETGLAELRRFVSSGGAGESAGLASLQEAQGTLDAALKQVSDDQQALTARLGELTAKLPDTSDLSGGLAELRDRATTLGQDLEDLKGSLTGLRQELDTLSNGQTSLAARVEEGVASLTARLTALDDRLSPVEARMGDVSARETAARAVAVSSLRAAMDRGEPYATELAAVASALPEGTDLSALTARADRGVPTRSVLKANFPAVARTMAAEIDAPADGDLVGGLLANARALVSIRQPGESDAATPQAALGRMEARVDSGDLAGALTAYEELPQTVRAAGADWVADARARLAVDALMDRVTGDVLKSMGGSAAPAASN